MGVYGMEVSFTRKSLGVKCFCLGNRMTLIVYICKQCRCPVHGSCPRPKMPIPQDANAHVRRRLVSFRTNNVLTLGRK